MNNTSKKNYIDWSLVGELKEFLSLGHLGFEKEGLRIFDSGISFAPHPKLLGSSLCNQFITTDFCEAQLELITPPIEDKHEALNFLDDLHHFVICNIDNEILWPFSMPPKFSSSSDIKIADYGPSNVAMFKHTYRKGLSARYGREMQAISGLHYNYSLPDQVWDSSLIQKKFHDSEDKKSTAYFNMIRNCYRYNWLLLYLFGASPVINKNFIKKNQKEFRKVNQSTYYLPYATSLRMSDLGYRNSKRMNFHISLNSLNGYVQDLRKANKTISKDFLRINKQENNKYHSQLNSNILQIEDEYYAIARAKSSDNSHQRFTTKLVNGGVDFIELRSLDINPFKKIGIDDDTTLFIEVFLIYCFLNPSPFLNKKELEEYSNNDLSVSKFGRDPNLLLNYQNKKLSIKDWGRQILSDIEPIVEIIDNHKGAYKRALNKMKSIINNPDETIAARILNKIIDEKIDFNNLGNVIASENKEYYLKKKEEDNENWNLFQKTVDHSLNKQKALDEESQQSFENFVSDYFKV